jgi:1-phosphofructokinase
MIITLTPNPSVDRSVCIDAFKLGGVNRGTRSWSEPSGKGVNVAFALSAHDVPVVAVLPIGGPAGAHLVDMLDRTPLKYRTVPIDGEIRVNVSLILPDGVVTKINESGPMLSVAEARAMLDATAELVTTNTWLAGCGSLPGGVGDDYYAQVVEVGHRAGATVVVDTSGPALAAALAAGPDLIKPNAFELAETAGGSVATIGDVVDAAQELRRRGAGAVLASLGADGAVLVDATGAWHGEATVERVVSSVGAGDAMLAGYLYLADSRPDQPAAALASALAWGASAVQHQGTLLTGADRPSVVTISETVPRRRRLRID